MSTIRYLFADEDLKHTVINQWKDYFPDVGKYICLEDGFTIVAMCEEQAVGLLSVSWRELPSPLPNTMEAFIMDIEVLPEYRRRGIARSMIAMATDRAVNYGAYQIRAWSSNDKTEAIPMWKALGFGMCPQPHGYNVAKVLQC